MGSPELPRSSQAQDGFGCSGILAEQLLAVGDLEPAKLESRGHDTADQAEGRRCGQLGAEPTPGRHDVLEAFVGRGAEAMDRRPGLDQDVDVERRARMPVP